MKAAVTGEVGSAIRKYRLKKKDDGEMECGGDQVS